MLRRLVLDEAHRAPYSAHPGVHKMLETLKKAFYWVRMKRDIVQCVAHCLYFQQVKAKYNHPIGILRPHEVPESKWEVIYMEFVGELPIYMIVSWFWWTNSLRVGTSFQ